MAYASEHLSLAAIELFVHVRGRENPTDLVAIQADVPVDERTLQQQKGQLLAELPKDWRFHENSSRAWGDAWIQSATSLAVLVPSVVIDVEWNVLINPQHPDAPTLQVVQRRPFQYDERMFIPL